MGLPPLCALYAPVRKKRLIVLLVFARLGFECREDQSCQRGANKWSHNEHPYLRQGGGVTLREHGERRSKAAGGVDRSARQRNANDVNEGERQADGDAPGGVASRRLPWFSPALFGRAGEGRRFSPTIANVCCTRRSADVRARRGHRHCKGARYVRNCWLHRIASG